ncbi:uncharacterized protein LOC124353265 [Homalodisca vitripennis]|nr:uncharacterized protein LOC124353265 [Homalodisca vitripennis]
MSAADSDSDPASPSPPPSTPPLDTAQVLLHELSPYPKQLKAAHINAQSLRGHVDDISAIFRQQTFDIILISESWLKPSIPSSEIQSLQEEPPRKTVVRRRRPMKQSASLNNRSGRFLALFTIVDGTCLTESGVGVLERGGVVSGPCASSYGVCFLSLFTIVEFDNKACLAGSGDNGTCLTESECLERGGVVSGPCASSYGVCFLSLFTIVEFDNKACLAGSGDNGTCLTESECLERVLSLFTIVEFDNKACLAASGDNGTCLTESECLERGGVVSGPCASSYGVCCLFMATCGQSTNQNCSYFVNPGYPSFYDGSGSCQLTIYKAHPDICQYRLDFDNFVLDGPETMNHICNNDQFLVSGGSPVPAICGINSGNHMYVDAGLGTSPVTLTVVTSGPAMSRHWKIKVCQIPCSSSYKAEDGCLQYFTGVSGQIKSFNYEPLTGLHLSNQDYSICIRMERNFCGIQYMQCPDEVNNRTHSFTLTGNTLGQNAVTSMIGGVGPNSCNTDWLIIPCTSNVGRVPSSTSTGCVDRLCGGTLNSEVSTFPATVYSTVKPFRIVFHTNNVEAPNDVGNRGFCLDYVQQPCTNAPNPL